MMKTSVLLDGKVINIGSWDYQLEDGMPTNPLPDGAEEIEIEVVQDAGGGWAPADDYAALRRVAYPPYSLWDVVDEMLKHMSPEPGSRLEQMQVERQAVKDLYPKPPAE